MPKITGRVIDRKTRIGVAGLRIESWDKEQVVKDQVASAVTNTEGVFEIQLEDAEVKKLFRGRKPDLFFKVFADGRLLRSTEDSVLWNLEKSADVVIEGDFVTAPIATPIVIAPVEQIPEVRGTIRMADGFPANGFAVAAFDRDLRREEELGRAQTDAQGFYRIRYKL
ncbi:MAG TPA: hypothetical protein VFY34_15415 [Pyrinomonadaceae bacterium]|nr:hypothetical protein [Pyrinomonadaceae bacterium]